MHQLAIALNHNGHRISGSDDEIFDPALSNLKKHGLISDEYLWNPENITSEIDLVILGMHARKDNPELIRAQQLGIEVLSFPEFVYRQSINKKRVVVGGSHGKTTITSMIMHVLKDCGLSFDYLVGSAIRGFDTMVSLTQENSVIVIEGDEYLSSCLDPRPKFHVYHADIAVISGVEWDHINVYPHYDDYLNAFRVFAEMIPETGSLIYCSADEQLQGLMHTYEGSAHVVAYSEIPFIQKDNQVCVLLGNTPIPVQVFGRHNMLNMSAAHQVCRLLGIADESFFASIAGFRGAAKRLEMIHESDNLRMFRDFAHAPSKLKATVDAVRHRYPNDNLIAVFELHTFSSMNPAFLAQYSNALNLADFAAVYFSPHAFQLKKLKLFSKGEICNAFNRPDIAVLSSPAELFDFAEKHNQKRTTFLLMSSGNFDNINFEELVLGLRLIC